MPRLIDADALILEIATAGQDNKGGRYVVGDIWELNFQEIREVINNASTVDAVEVVRCKDCVHYFDDGCGNTNYDSPAKRLLAVRPDWFCADGERREE